LRRDCGGYQAEDAIMVTASRTQVYQSVEDDHRRLEQLIARLREVEELPALVAALDELNVVLVAHFGHEEQPEGLYDVLGTNAPEYKTPLGGLIDEHYKLLASARELADHGRALLRQSQDGLRRDVRRLADALADHERRENELAAALLKGV
jgi:hypothetical protein